MGYLETMSSAGSRKDRTPEPIPITLAELEENLDAHFSRETRFAQHVRDYRKFADRAAVLDSRGEYRLAITQKMDRFIETGQGVIAGQRIVKQRRGASEAASLPSAAVKKRYPRLWEAARVPTGYLQISRGGEDNGAPALVVPPMASARQVWAAYEQAKSMLTEANRVKDAAKDQLHAIIAAMPEDWPDGWPKLTTDGWIVGRREELRFNQARCVELAEAQGIDLEPVRIFAPRAGRTVYALVDPDESDELDEIDGP